MQKSFGDGKSIIYATVTELKQVKQFRKQPELK